MPLHWDMAKQCYRWCRRCSFTVLILLTACADPGDSLSRIIDSGELRLVTRFGASTYYVDRGEQHGFEYDLARLLAEDLGVSLQVSTGFTLDALFRELRRGEADIAGAGLTLTHRRRSEFPTSAGYHQHRPQVIYRVGRPRPVQLEELEGLKLAVLKGSSHLDLLERLRRESGLHFELQVIRGAHVIATLRRVEAGPWKAICQTSSPVWSQMAHLRICGRPTSVMSTV